MRLLLTRPEPEAQRTADALRARGHEVLLMPMLRIEAVSDAAIANGPWSAVVMTSANAARAIAKHSALAILRTLPAFVVGAHTAEAAKAAGFADVTSAEGDGAALARVVIARAAGNAGPLLYLAGEPRSPAFEDALASRKIDLNAVVVYRAIAVPELSAEVKSALAAGSIAGALHFSRRSAAAFLHAAERAGALPNALGLRHYCLSTQVAGAFGDKSGVTIHVAPHPNERALIALVP
jgi:uroporphyrinogen-III synthase